MVLFLQVEQVGFMLKAQGFFGINPSTDVPPVRNAVSTCCVGGAAAANGTGNGVANGAAANGAGSGVANGAAANGSATNGVH